MVLSIDIFSWNPLFPTDFLTILRLFLTDPFFWAISSLISIFVGVVFVSGVNKKLSSNPVFGIIIIIFASLGRIMLVLPFCPQPRFELNGLEWVIGGVILVIAAIIGIPPTLSIKFATAPDEEVKLKTTGMYKLSRNPIYLAEILFSLGLSIGFQSIIGIILVPLWWFSFLLLVLLEEQGLESALGQQYLEYKKNVRGRIIPLLPI